MRHHPAVPLPTRRLRTLGLALTLVASSAALATARPRPVAAVPAALAPRRAPADVASRGGRPGLPGFEMAMAAGPLTQSSIAPTPTPPPTPTPAPRTEVLTYQVQPGDNLFVIAQRFKLSQDTIVWANPEVESDPDYLQIGQELKIPPTDGVLHTVKAGDTLAAIAARYKVDPAAILAYAPNHLSDPSALSAGQQLMVPGGIRPAPPRPTPAPVAAGSAAPASISGGVLMIPAGAPDVPVAAPAQPGRFIWPTHGVITQYYGRWHGAIDIANNQGTPIVAADAGTVTFAGWSGGLGNAIQIDHGDGFATTYAHLYSIGVQVGQKVEKGAQIGLMGTTGHSTGPHLHLIFTYKGGIINPLDYLPQ